jgi:hypothetical protein
MRIKLLNLLKIAIIEFSLFSAQSAIFFLVALFLTHLLESRDLLNTYTESKLGRNLIAEFSLTLIGVLVVLGVLFLIARIARTNALGRLSEEVLQEVPRTIYYFGSTITGTGLAWVFHEGVYGSPDDAIQTLFTAAKFASASFAIGFILKASLSGHTPPLNSLHTPRGLDEDKHSA